MKESGASTIRATVDRNELRRALGSFLTGVTIVTALDAGGRPRGMTANSFTSVSLDPPLVLVCVDRSAASYDTFSQCSGFAVHILGAEQQDLAATFAGKAPSKFDGLETCAGLGGAPILPLSAAWLDCRAERQIVVGDHVLVIGEVLSFGVSEHRPLGYHQGKYVSLVPEQAMLDGRHSSGLQAAWIAETRDGSIVLQPGADGRGCSVPNVALSFQQLDENDLTAAAANCLGAPTEVGFLYSIFDRPDANTLMLAYRVRVDADDAEVGTARPELACFPAESIPWDEVEDPAIAAMLARYVTERAGERFGLYAGSAAQGRIATITNIDDR